MESFPRCDKLRSCSGGKGLRTTWNFLNLFWNLLFKRSLQESLVVCHDWFLGIKGTRRIFGRLILYFVSSQILRHGILFVSSRYSNFFLFDNFLSLHVHTFHVFILVRIATWITTRTLTRRSARWTLKFRHFSIHSNPSSFEVVPFFIRISPSLMHKKKPRFSRGMVTLVYFRRAFFPRSRMNI